MWSSTCGSVKVCDVPFESNESTKALIVVLDSRNSKYVNILDRETIEALAKAIQHIRTEFIQSSLQHACKLAAVVFCSAKATSFCHGADVSLQQDMVNEEDLRDGVSNLKQLFQSIEDLPVPTICYIAGTTLGGGLELALSCDYRFASPGLKQIGLPEVQLGVIPGAGGCVRLPRLVGLAAALDLILTGKSISSEKANNLGIITAITTQSSSWICINPDQARLPMLQSLPLFMGHLQQVYRSGKIAPLTTPKQKYPNHVFGHTWIEKQLAYSVALKSIDKVARRVYPAPYRLLDTLFRCWNSSYVDAFAIETDTYVLLARTHEAKAFMSLFTAKSRAKHAAFAHFQASASPIESQSRIDVRNQLESDSFRVLVLGAGHMGGGIAQHAHECGCQVILFDISDDALEFARSRAIRLYSGSRRRPRMSKSDAEAKLKTLVRTSDLDVALNLLCAQSNAALHRVVIEAAPENLDIKLKLVRKVLAHNPHVIFATNTSSIPIHQISGAVPDQAKSQVIGLHFFHPEGNITPVVEIIPTPETSHSTGQAVTALAVAMKKVPVVVGNGPGFVVNNVCSAWYASAAAIVVFGGSSVERVDQTMVECGCISGPFSVLDSITISTATMVCESMMSLVGDKNGEPLLALLRAMLAKGYTGRSSVGSSKGFYLYRDGKSIGINPEIKSLAQVVRVHISNPGAPIRRMSQLSKLDLADYILFTTIYQACKLLDNGVASSAQDIDLLVVLSMGILPRYGGIMAYADTFKPGHIVNRLAAIRELVPFPPTSSDMANFTPIGCNTADNFGSNRRFRPDIPDNLPSLPKGVGPVSILCPNGLGIADAAIAASIAILGGCTFGLMAKL